MCGDLLVPKVGIAGVVLLNLFLNALKTNKSASGSPPKQNVKAPAEPKLTVMMTLKALLEPTLSD